MINYKKLLQSKIVKTIWEWTEVIIIAFVLAIIVKAFVLETDIVSGKSMEPSFEEGEKVFVEKISYIFGDPKRGDVIIFIPEGKKEKYIKRVLGLPGDIINVKDGTLTINDEVIKEDYIQGETYQGINQVTYPYIVGEGEYFVLGDNRLHSEDSRYIKLGKVTKANIVGKVCMVVSPLENMRLVRKIEYSINK